MGQLSFSRARHGSTRFGLSPLQLLVASGVSLSLLVGCGGGDSKQKDGQAPTTTSTVDSVAMDGFLLVMTSDGLRLLDPETGKASADALSVSGEPNPSNHYSVSPNGRQIACVGSGGTLVIADVTFEDGVPGFKTVRELKGDTYTRPRYTSDGERILTTNVAIDPVTGDTWPCLAADARPSGNFYPLAPLPGGHRYVCPEAGQLKEDGDVLASKVSANVVTADGQFADVNVHVPSATKRDVQNESVPEVAGHAQLPDGGLYGLYGSGSGQQVEEDTANYVTVYRSVSNELAQKDGALFALPDAFESGDWSKAKTGEWPMQDVGFPVLTEGDGRDTLPVGISQDEQYALYRSSAWLIESDQYTDALHENVIETGFSVVDRHGKVKSFKTTSLGDLALYSAIDRDVQGAVLFQPELFQDTSLVDFGDGNMLVPVSGNGLAGIGWGGYLDGKPYIAQGGGRMSRDGRWFFADAKPVSPTSFPICLTRVGTDDQQCLATKIGGTPVAVVGYGLKSAHQKDAPEISGTSRSAAWLGSSVTVFGAHFGDSGTLRIGDQEVATADIDEWADDHVTFTVADDVPKSGRLVVETEHGKAGMARAFWFYQTRLVETPFDAVKVGAVSLGQGLNVVNLGDYDAGEPKSMPAAGVALDNRTRLDTGEYVIYSPGAAEPTVSELELTSGGLSRTVYFQLENRMADDTKWQLVQPSGIVDLSAQYPSFRTIAGDLIEFALGSHPIVNERVELGSFASRVPSTVAAAWGPPDYWREAADDKSALVLNKTSATSRAFNQVTGWTAEAKWGAPVFAPSPQGSFLPFVNGVEAADKVVILTGSDLLGTGKAGFQLSTDGGKSFGTMTLVDQDLGNPQSSLLEPIRVEAKAGTFFVVLESLGVGDVIGIHGISTDGVLTKGIAATPADAKLPAGLAPQKASLDYLSVGGKLMLHFPVSHTLIATDFDAAAGATAAWTAVPSAKAAGHVLNIWHDVKAKSVYAVLDDGSVLTAAQGAFDDPSAWKPLDLGIDLALPTEVQPLAVSRLEDGRWFVLAALKDAKKPSERSPYGDSGFLVGPKP